MTGLTAEVGFGGDFGVVFPFADEGFVGGVSEVLLHEGEEFGEFFGVSGAVGAHGESGEKFTFEVEGELGEAMRTFRVASVREVD